EQGFGGRLPTPAEMLAADPDAVRERHVNAQGGNLAGGGATLRRWPAERRCVVRHVGRGRRGRADQHSGDRTVDGARLPARRARPTRRVPDGRRRAPAGIGERLRLRPSPNGRRDAPAGRTLATRIEASRSATCSPPNTTTPHVPKPELRARADLRGRVCVQRDSVSTASAKAAIDGNVQSGVTAAGGSGVAPEPGFPWRRLIQTDGNPAALAGT